MVLQNLNQLKWGGFEVERIRLYFARTTENGQIVDDKKHTYFYIGEYTLKKMDPSNEYNDIKLLDKKLSRIYGDYDTDEHNWTYDCQCH